MKKKRIIGIISLFMCVALVGVGFAAWVITGDASGKQDGNLQVEVVEDKRLGVGSIALTESSIVFGAPSGASDTGKWLQASAVPTEVLSTKLTFSVSNFAECTGVEITLNPVTKDKEKYDAAVSNKLIVSPKEMGETTTLEPTEDGNFEITFTWAWGKEFSLDGNSAGANPYTFYNTFASGAGVEIGTKRGSASKTNAEYALEALGTTNESGLASLDEVGFTIGIKAISTAAKA